MIMHIDSNISVLNTYTNTKEKISTWIKFFYFSIFWKTLLFAKKICIIYPPYSFIGIHRFPTQLIVTVR